MISGGGEQLQSRVEGSGRGWRGAIAGGGERSQVEATPLVGRAAKLHDFYL